MSKLIKAIIFLLIVIVLLPLGLSIFIDQERAKSVIRSNAKAALSRDVYIEGRLGFKIALSPTVYVEGVQLVNNTWGSQPNAFTAKKLTFSFSLIELLFGRLKIRSIDILEPKLFIEKNDNGQFNLDFSKNTITQKEQLNFLPWLVEVSEIEIEGGEVIYRQKNRYWEIVLDEVTIESNGLYSSTYVQWKGSVEKTPVSAIAQLGSLHDIFSQQKIELLLHGAIDDTELTVSGIIENLIRWKGIHLWGRANIPQLTALSDIAGVKFPMYENIMAKWEWIQPDKISSLRMDSILIQSKDYGLKTVIQGSIGQLVGFNDINLDIRSQGVVDQENLPHNLKHVDIISSIFGRIYGNKDNLALLLDELEVQMQGLTISTSGKIESLLGRWTQPLPLIITVDSLLTLGRVFNYSLPDVGSIVAHANLGRNKQKLTLSKVTVRNIDDTITANFDGQLNVNSSEITGETKAMVSVKNFAFLEHLLTKKYPRIENVNISGTFKFGEKNISTDNLTIAAVGDNLLFHAQGFVQDIKSASGVDLDMMGWATGLESFSSLVGLALPVTARVNANARLVSNEQKQLDLVDIKVGIEGQAMTTDVYGRILDVTDTRELNFRLNSKLTGINFISHFLPDNPTLERLKDLLPAIGNCQILHSANTPWQIKDIDIRSGSQDISVSLQGYLKSLFPMEGEILINTFGKLSASTLLLKNIDFLKDSIHRGTFIGNANLEFAKSSPSLKDINILVESPGSSLKVLGSIESFNPFRSDHLITELNIAQISDLVKDKDLMFRLDNSVNGKISLRDMGEGRNFKIDLSIGQSNLQGNIKWRTILSNTKKEKQEIIARLQSSTIDLTQLLVDVAKSNKIFSDNPLKLGWISNKTIDIEFNIKRFVNNLLTVSNMSFDSKIKLRSLTINAVGESRKGALNLALELHDSGKLPRINLKIDGKEVDTSALTKVNQSPDVQSGVFSIDVDLSGEGQSVAEIASKANGAIELAIQDAQFKSDSLNMFGGDITSELLSVINPFKKKKDEFVEVECGVMHFQIAEGKASTEQGLALKTDKVTLLGGGDINLSNEEIRILIAPKARKGLGISASSVAKMLRIGGTLANPKIEADVTGFLKTGVAIGAAIASGGLSLFAQGIIDRTRANSDVCDIAAKKSKKIEGKQQPDELKQ